MYLIDKLTFNTQEDYREYLKTSEDYCNTYKRWTKEEDIELQKLSKERSLDELCHHFKRVKGSIRSRLLKLQNIKDEEDTTKNDLSEEFYDSGHLKIRGNLKNNVREGTWKFFNEEGELIYIKNYKDGERHGPQLMFYEKYLLEEVYNVPGGVEMYEDFDFDIYQYSGNLSHKSYYLNGKAEGNWESFTPDGVLEVSLSIKYMFC